VSSYIIYHRFVHRAVVVAASLREKIAMGNISRGQFAAIVFIG
jgi:hypothetical protein